MQRPFFFFFNDADLARVRNHSCVMPNFHTSSTNGVFLRCPLAAMVFLPSTNFFAAYKTKNVIEIWLQKKYFQFILFIMTIKY